MPLEPRGHAEAAAQCRALAERLDWSQTVLDTWPTPLATEYWRVRHELQQGRTMDALLQLMDFAEVLVKLPVLLATRLLLAAGPRQPARAGPGAPVHASPSSPPWIEGGATRRHRGLGPPKGTQCRDGPARKVQGERLAVPSCPWPMVS